MKRYNITSEHGFTLIEIMIVIAILGMLAAIAIPNYISYRDKGFCSLTESDANSVAGAVADYFALPSHTALVNDNLHAGVASWKVVTLTAGNTFTVNAAAPNTAITITVTDVSGRCPSSYMAAATSTTNAKGYWDPTTHRYTKIIAQ